MSIKMTGVEVNGVKVDGADVFKEEMVTVSKPKRVKSVKTSTKTTKRKARPDRDKRSEWNELSKLAKETGREACPAWVITGSFTPKWPFNFKISQIRRWWRFGIISEELLLMQCSSCKKSFTIMRSYYQGGISCPYCNGATSSIADQESYLTALCKQLLRRAGKPFVEEKK